MEKTSERVSIEAAVQLTSAVRKSADGFEKRLEALFAGSRGQAADILKKK